MQTSEQKIEAEIVAKGKTGPRITPDMINAEIGMIQYHVFEGSCLTVCALTLRNGYTVTGESACADPANFDAEIGRKIANENARQKIWPLMGFRLRDQLREAGAQSRVFSAQDFHGDHPFYEGKLFLGEEQEFQWKAPTGEEITATGQEVLLETTSGPKPIDDGDIVCRVEGGFEIRKAVPRED